MAEPNESTGQNESVLSRWSRLKRGGAANKSIQSESDISSVSPQLNGDEAGGVNAVSNGLAQAESGPTDSVAPREASAELPSLDEISLDRDFTPFMQAKVPEVLKRQALKALFKDPHFNTMDGLDIYIDDYTKFEPISAAELEGLSAWKSISKPLQQVVTPGGYAVDVESEEGKAVLAARERLAALNESGELGATAPLENDPMTDHAVSEPQQSAPPTSPRYGKRVGDFRYEDPDPPAALPEANAHQSIPSSVSPVPASTDDPR